jgi:hypothetical protein
VALLPAVCALADDDSDALKLEGAPPEAAPAGLRDTKIFLEGAVGNSSRRYQLGSQDIRRVSLDFSHTSRLGNGLRVVLSDRIDYLYPDVAGTDATTNSLREAYVSWQGEGGSTVVEFGRINLRYGPAYGYNPTDFFRDGSLRTLTTANPFALRENRLGSVMLRAQRLWADGSLSVALSPKLANNPSQDGWSLDLGSTNNTDRALVALGSKLSQLVSIQLLAYKVDGLPTTLGASMTTLLSDAATAQVEWSRGKEPDLFSRALRLPSPSITRNRLAGGLSYTTAGKLSITAEYQYNGFALSKANAATLAANSPSSQVAYLIDAQRRQDLAPRQAYLIYVTQKDLFLKDMDLTAFVRVNAGDRSRLAWMELRRHWSSFDVAFQLQQHLGSRTSEYGILPDRRVIQLLGTYYF